MQMKHGAYRSAALYSTVSSMQFYHCILDIPQILLSPQMQIPLSTQPGMHGNHRLFFFSIVRPKDKYLAGRALHSVLFFERGRGRLRVRTSFARDLKPENNLALRYV